MSRAWGSGVNGKGNSLDYTDIVMALEHWISVALAVSNSRAVEESQSFPTWSTRLVLYDLPS